MGSYYYYTGGRTHLDSRALSHERRIRRQSPLQLYHFLRLAVANAADANTRLSCRDGPKHPQRRVQGPVKPSALHQLADRILQRTQWRNASIKMECSKAGIAYSTPILDPGVTTEEE